MYTVVSSSVMVKQVKAGKMASLYPMIVEKARATHKKLPQSEQTVTSIQDLIAEGRNHLVTHVVKKFKPSKKVKFITLASKALDNFYTDILRAHYTDKRTVKMLSADTTIIGGVRLSTRLARMPRFDDTEDVILKKIDAERAFFRAYSFASSLLRRYMIRWILQPSEDGRCKPGEKFNAAYFEFQKEAVHEISMELCDFIQNNYECRTSISDELVRRFRTSRRKTQNKFYHTEEFAVLPILSAQALGEVVIG